MCSPSGRFFLSIIVVLMFSGFAAAQRPPADSEFGPVMRAYLGYLHNEQEVVDDRVSRREITTAYYRRNSNRIHALRTTAMRLVRESQNDYVPELEAVTADEFRMIFEHPPRPASFRQNEVVANKFRYLGSVRTGETFYVFARLDPYEQAELIQRERAKTASDTSGGGPAAQRVGDTTSRTRRVVPK